MTEPILESVGPEAMGVSWLVRLTLPLLLVLASATVWNVIGALDFADVDEGTIVRFSGDQPEADARGARLVVDWIDTRTRLSWNPFRVLWQQLWYNAFTSDYDLVLWLEPANGDLDRRHYAIYQKGRVVFLRLEFDGKNRVLDAEFTAEELERALAPFLFDGTRPAEALPAD